MKINRKLLEKIDEIFAKKLEVKTGWGKNEVLAVYHEAVKEALMELLD